MEKWLKAHGVKYFKITNEGHYFWRMGWFTVEATPNKIIYHDYNYYDKIKGEEDITIVEVEIEE